MIICIFGVTIITLSTILTQYNKIKMNESTIDALSETSKVAATLAADMLGDMLEQYMVAAYSASLNSDMSNPNYSFAEKKAILEAIVPDEGAVHLLSIDILDKNRKSIGGYNFTYPSEYLNEAYGGATTITSVTRLDVREPYSFSILAPIRDTYNKGYEVCGAVVYTFNADFLHELLNEVIIGSNGSMLKQIGVASRKDIEELTGTKVMIDLFVKVKKDWKDDSAALSELGFNKKDI